MSRILITILLGCFLNVFHAQTTIEIDCADHTMHARSFGSGTPILIINGGPGMNSNGFAALAKALGKDYRAIIYDQRGTGKSILPQLSDQNISIELMLLDIEYLRKQLNIESWYVLGHSFGGMIAGAYAAKFPKAIKGIIFSSSGGLDMELFSILNINSKLTTSQQDSLNYWSQKLAQGDTTYHAKYNRGRFLAPAYLYDKQYVPTIAHRLTQLNSRVNQLVFQDMQKINFNQKQSLQKFEKPVLILQGKNDIIPEVIARRTAEVLPQSEIVLIEKCGHYPWLENPEVYFEAIGAFVGR